MSRRDASSRSTKSRASSRAATTRSDSRSTNERDLSIEERIELEEKESRIALSLSIMHNAMQASNVDGSSSNFTYHPSSRTGLSDNHKTMKSDQSGGQSDTSEKITPIERHLIETGWNLDKIHTVDTSHDLNQNTQNRRVCMCTCALIASSIVSVMLAGQKLGFPSVKEVVFKRKSEEKIKYSGNYTEISSITKKNIGGNSNNDQQKQTEKGYSVQDKKKTKMSSKNYKKELYKIPDNVDGNDDFVHVDQVLPTFGNSIRHVLSYCFKAVSACETDDKHDQKSLEVFEKDGVNYVNVNTESSEGIKRAKSLKLIQSGLAATVFSSRLNEIISIFSIDHRARAFTLLRHPVERIISEFYQQQARDPHLALTSLAEHFLNNGNKNTNTMVIDNYIVRTLVNKPIAELTSYDLDLAMLILKKKFLIGLVNEIEESIKRFRYYFNWKTKGLKGINECVMTFTSPSPRQKPIVSKASRVWALLAETNKWDVKLYDFALHLFDVQGLLLKKSRK